jgi:hypothetical protein
LDLIENSLAAGARTIEITVTVDAAGDRLTLEVDDDGRGFPVPPEKALDPFYSTKSGKRTGLGLSLFAASCQRAGGRLELGRSPLGGARVRATMQMGHIDGAPMGDLAATFTTMAVTNPSVELRLRLSSGAEEASFSTAAGGNTPVSSFRDADFVKKITGGIHSFLTKAGLF